jgi:hypothetical protein
MKVDLRRPSNSVILHIGNASTPPIFPLPPSGAEAKQFFTLLTFLPSYRLMSNVGKATQTPRTHGCTLVFGVSGASKVVKFPSSTSGYRISWTRFGTTFSDSETKRVELQRTNVSGALLVSPFFPFCQLPQGSGFSQASQRHLQVAVFQRGPTIVAGWRLYANLLSPERWGGPRAYVDLALDRQYCYKDCGKEGRLRGEGTGGRRLDEPSAKVSAVGWSCDYGWRWRQ